MNRRTFMQLSGLAAVAVALPLSVRAKRHVLHGDGYHDDSAALQAWFDGKDVHWPDGSKVGDSISSGHFLLGKTLHVGRGPQGRHLSFCDNTMYLGYGKSFRDAPLPRL